MLKDKEVKLSRIVFFTVTIFWLYLGFESVFEHDFIKMNLFFTVVLVCGFPLVLSFPSFRLDTRYKKIANRISGRPDFDQTIIKMQSNQKIVGRLKKLTEPIIAIFMVIFASGNFIIGLIAYYKGNISRFIIHMVVCLITQFVCSGILFTLKVDDRFNRLEQLISEWKKEQSTE